jgi:hypothetical protein
MRLLDALAEQRIAVAEARGELSALPGAGKPLEFDDDLLVPEEVRAVYRFLKNAGVLPPEIEKRRARLAAEAAERKKRRARLMALDFTLKARRGHALHIPAGYEQKILDGEAAKKREKHGEDHGQ